MPRALLQLHQRDWRLLARPELCCRVRANPIPPFPIRRPGCRRAYRFQQVGGRMFTAKSRNSDRAFNMGIFGRGDLAGTSLRGDQAFDSTRLTRLGKFLPHMRGRCCGLHRRRSNLSRKLHGPADGGQKGNGVDPRRGRHSVARCLRGRAPPTICSWLNKATERRRKSPSRGSGERGSAFYSPGKVMTTDHQARGSLTTIGRVSRRGERWVVLFDFNPDGGRQPHSVERLPGGSDYRTTTDLRR